MSRMGSSTLWGKISVLVAVCGWCLSAQAKYGGGSSTEAEPYRIGAVSDWQELMTTPADWDSHFVLTADIDLNDVPMMPVDSYSQRFIGVFDGNDYVIHNADVNMPDGSYVGLFGYLGTDGQIKNLGVEDTSIFGSYRVGGLVGYNSGTISACYSSGSASTGFPVGGLVGHNDGTISNSYLTASVSGIGWRVGGLVGENGTNQFYCEMPDNCWWEYYPGWIYKCYSTGNVSRGREVGGLVGVHVAGEVADSFWDVETSDCNISAGGTPKTTEEMKTQSTFTDATWDFIEVWDIGENQTYPFLRTYLAGDINHDGVVDFRDITHLAGHWLSGL